MDKDDVGNRMALGITTILTIMFLLGSLNGNLPKVSYPKALDWYLLVSFSFVFFSLIECLIVFLVTRSAESSGEEKVKYKVYITTDLDVLPFKTKPYKKLFNDHEKQNKQNKKQQQEKKLHPVYLNGILAI